jgi:AcrR family transcriptional regulator
MRRGRRAGKARSREAVLRSARALFAKHGFAGTSMRAVAARAGVDSALVHYFFETKEKLFRAAVAVPPDASAPLLAAGGPALARYYLDALLPQHRESIAALLRAAVADPSSVPALRRSLEDAVVSRGAGALKGRDARLRVELAGALVVGLFVCRELMKLQPLASVPTARLTPRVGRAFDALLSAAPRSRGSRSRGSTSARR